MAKSQRIRGILRSFRKWLVIAALALLTAPTVLVALYAVVDPPLTPLMVIRLLAGEGLDKRWMPLERISPHLPEAVIAAEDNRFCEHHGFDWKELKGQLDRVFQGERPRGASTITMQTAKNILLWPARDPLRKLLEAWLTPQIELMWSKRRILEVYLNVAEFGAGIYGAEAASRTFFGRAASNLDAGHAALLAAVLPDPRQFSPVKPSAYIRHRAGVIRHRIAQLGPLLACART